MSTPEIEEAPSKGRRNLLLIGGAITLALLCCICSLIWLAWIYGDSIIEVLLSIL